MIRSTGKLELANTRSPKEIYIIIYRGIFINLLNPKLTLFFFSFLPQYVSNNSHSYVRESMILGIIFMLLTLIAFSCYGILSSLVNHFIEASPKRLQHLQQIFGIIFIAFAAKLAFSCFGLM
jgi:threonine/homoserine/homoserine lactone efflux protein